MRIAGLDITIDRTAYLTYLILGLIPAVMRGGYTALFRGERHTRTIVTAPLLGVSIAVYHALAQLVHQYGHALAARAAGYPMAGVRHEYGFTYSEYPLDESVLPDHVHIQRSLGGVGGTSLVLVIALLLWLRRGMSACWFTRWLLAFILLDSLLLFIASAVFSDGLLFLQQKAWQTTEPNA